MSIIIPSFSGVSISKHQIRGNINGVDDTSLENIAKLYNQAWKEASFPLSVTWQEIADLNFGSHTVKAIYDWLSTHGGTRQGPYSGHTSGYHWSFTPGQILIVPGPLSLSLPDDNATVTIGDPEAPIVQPGTTSQPGNSQAVPKDETQKLASEQTSSPAVAKAGAGTFGIGWIVGIGLMVAAVMLSKNKTENRSGSKRSRSSKKRRR